MNATSLSLAPLPLLGSGRFDLQEYLTQFSPEGLEKSPDYRRWVSKFDPLAYALIYLSHHLKGDETGGAITLSEFHLDLIEQAKRWILPTDQPAQHRDAYVAPRDSGKSTWLFTLLPLWAASHGWRKFIAAFADSASQAELHLATFRRELETNALLRNDFPDLCTAARREAGAVTADRAGMLVTKAGFTFAARGIDSNSLGMKVSEKRPDLLIMDDIEPDESSYSAYQKSKRESTLVDAILPLNIYARVVISGTVTMPGSLIHDLVKTRTQPGETPAEWVTNENFTCHYYPAIITDDDGTERSLWPAKWSLNYLQSVRHTRSFKKNMLNDPVASDGSYWTEEDFRYDVPSPLARRLLSIDPATTTKTTSDYTGLAVIGYAPVSQRCALLHSSARRLPPGQLRAHVLALIDQYDVGAVLIETNQGGDAWKEILSPLPCKIAQVHQSEPKDVRAARVLDYYQSGWVAHDGSQRAFEDQAVVYPNGMHDDVVDAVGSGMHYFLKDRKRSRQVASSVAYA